MQLWICMEFIFAIWFTFKWNCLNFTYKDFSSQTVIKLTHVIINLILKRRFIQGGFILHHLCWSQALIPSMFHEHNLFNRAYQIHGCVLTLNIMGLWKLPVIQSFLNSHSHRCKQIFLIQGLSYSGHCES